MKEFDDLIETCKKSLKLCPWAKEQGVKGYANEIRDEADEVIEAVKNNDIKNMAEEIGDVMNDCINLALTAGLSIQEILKGADEKMHRRKPFLLEGKKVSFDEAKRIWKKVKEEEKNG